MASGQAFAMLTALGLAIDQLPERGLRGPLFATLFWSVVVVALFVFAVADEAKRLTLDLDDGFGALGALALMTLAAGVVWLLFVAVENAILFCYADRIVEAVERRHYPGLPPPRRGRTGAMLAAGLVLAVKTLVGNLVALPLYLLVPGANLVLFLLLNGYLFGRGYYDLIALRRWTNEEARRFWPACRGAFLVIGILSILALGIPLLNLVVPLIGLASSVHLFAGPAGWPAQHRLLKGERA